MKKIITISILFFSCLIEAQVFTGGGGAIQNNGQDTYFPIPISGLSPAQLDNTFGVEQVCININHPAIEELYVYLQSPAGIMVQLTAGSSCSGVNYLNTCFDNVSATSITLGSTPYSGNYKPIGYLGRFSTNQPGNGTWNLVIHDGFPATNAGSLISWSIQFGNSPAPAITFTSSNLPIVILNTTQAITDTKTLIDMGIIYNGPNNRNYTTDPMNSYNAKAQIHIRGSSTKNFEKKSYSIETADMSGNKLIGPLLGMPDESDWDLISPYQDKSLIRDPITYDISRLMGHYASRYKNVELILNNEYQGVYELTEKPKRDSNRIHVNKILPTDNTFPGISGGYVIKIDRTDAPGWSSLYEGNSTNNAHFYYQYDYPKATDITVPQQNYIKSYVDSFETVMNSVNYADPVIGYHHYIHTGSFVDFFIINELSKNVDAYRLSTYMYKDGYTHGGKLHIGPVWDYNIAWHNCNYSNADSPYGWQYQISNDESPVPLWWGRFMQDSNFVTALNCRWNELRQGILAINYLNNYIDSSANALYESQQRNFTQWPVLGAYIYPNPQSQTNATYWGEVGDLKNWIANRINWMDGVIGNISSACATGINENNFENNLVVYPNPTESDATFSLHLAKEADVSLCVTDLVGKEVARFLNTNAPTGNSKITFERNNIPAGVYFYQLQINNTIKKGKIILQ